MLSKETVIAAMKTKTAAVVVASTVSAAAGVATGVVYTIKRLEKQYVELANKEINEAKEFYRRQAKADQFRSPAEAVEHLHILDDAVAAMDKYQGKEFDDVTTAISKNIFTKPAPESEDEANWEMELAWRAGHPGEPFVISQVEYFNNDLEHDQVTVTYYAGDRVLSDSADQVVELIDKTVGRANLQRFGHWSQDPLVVYVRNEAIRTDFEILRAEGEYAVLVHNMPSKMEETAVQARDRFRNHLGTLR